MMNNLYLGMGIVSAVAGLALLFGVDLDAPKGTRASVNWHSLPVVCISSCMSAFCILLGVMA